MRLFGVALGAIGLKDLLTSLVAYHALAFRDHFVWPYLELPRLPYTGPWGWLPTAFQIVATLASLALVAGVAPRVASLALLGTYAYSFVGDRLAYTNNVYVFLLFLAAHALGSGPDPRVGRAVGRAVQLVVASIYVTGGVTKLTPFWFSGAILREALYGYQNIYRQLIDYDSPPAFRAIAGGVVATELFLAFGLWHKATRPFAIALGVALHAGIELLIPVRLFSYLMVASYLLFADGPAVRRADAALRRLAPFLRALAGLGAVWLLNRFFVHVTGTYEYAPLADLPLLIAVPSVGLLGWALPATARAPRPSRALPLLRAALPALLSVHVALLLKPAFGGTTDFAFRIFTDLLAVRVELWALEGDAWQKRPIDGVDRRWSDQHFTYTWTRWRDERPLLEAYAHWAAGHLRGARAVRLEVQVAQDLGPARVERWELPSTR
jgi:vitamin K-dependent gamma-carboxylase-like protein